MLLTLPEQSGPRPALLSLPALGTTSLDCDLTTTPLGAFLTRLSEAGFVTLRVVPPPDATLPAMLTAYRESFSQLASLPEVDPARVFVFGHSLGGTLAPHVAPDARGIVSYGAPSRAWSECMARSARRQLELFGLRGDELEREAEAAARLYRQVFEAGRAPREVLVEDPAIALSRAATDVRENLLFNRDPSFDRSLQALDLPAAWSRARNVLAVWGELDWVVDEDDHLRIATWAKRGAPLALSSLDHWMQRHPSREASFQKPGRGSFDPNWAEPVIEWLREEST